MSRLARGFKRSASCRPTRSGSSAGPTRRSRATSRPSADATTPTISRHSARARASAPAGSWHPPPSAARKARSANDSTRQAGSSMAAVTLRTSSSPTLHWTTSVPCPTAGVHTSASNRWLSSSSRPRRASPATATTRASNCPSRSLRMRVSRLPRTGTTSRSGRIASSCALRRGLPVARRAPCGSWPTLCPTRQISPSRGSSRTGNATSSRAGVIVLGTSFRLCTARSAAPPSSSSSTPLTNTPAPSEASGVCLSRSPAVLAATSSTSIPGHAARSRSATQSDCRSARMLPRVATRTRSGVTVGFDVRDPARELVADGWSLGQAEQFADSVDVDPRIVLATALLELHDRLVEHFVDDRDGQSIDRVAVAVGERPEPAEPPFELGHADLFSPRDQVGDRGRHLAALPPLHELVHFAVDERLHLDALEPALGQVHLLYRHEVVDVVQDAAGDLRRRRLDITRDRDVDHDQRTSWPAR